MGNPRPTKSKPCKIGRKHTGAPSIRSQAKKAKGRAINLGRVKAKLKRRKQAIAAYWRGESDSWPNVKINDKTPHTKTMQSCV